MTGSGGYLLQATKVYDDPAASSVTAHRRPKVKKAKVTDAATSEETEDKTPNGTSDNHVPILAPTTPNETMEGIP